MSLQDTIDRDVAGVFLNTNDFAKTLRYTVQGGVEASIPGILREQVEDVNDTGSATLNRDTRLIDVSAATITNPKRRAKDGGAGDTVLLPGSATVWYVVDILENGTQSGTGMHLLRITNKGVPNSRR